MTDAEAALQRSVERDVAALEGAERRTLEGASTSRLRRPRPRPAHRGRRRSASTASRTSAAGGTCGLGMSISIARIFVEPARTSLSPAELESASSMCDDQVARSPRRVRCRRGSSAAGSSPRARRRRCRSGGARGAWPSGILRVGCARGLAGRKPDIAATATTAVVCGRRVACGSGGAPVAIGRRR